MATVTPNFNWPVPTSTDLVKDGATAIEALGDSIDASFVDLKGGTTGQVLAKASNTDLDFSWVAQDDSNAIQNSIVDAKGDLIAASAADTPARLAVGNNGETLVADSSTSTGLRYQANFAAGKNKVINGDFGIWQRGTTFTNPADGSYTSDRFQIGVTGTPTTYTVSRQTFTPGTAPVAGYEGSFFYRSAQTTLGTLTNVDFWQKIENVQTLAGQTVTLSFWAKADSTRNLGLYVAQNFGSGGSGTTFPLDQTGSPASVTSSWQRFSYTFTMTSISGKTIGTNSYVQIAFRQAAATGYVLDIWGLQLEAGNTATAFQTATGTLQGELAACQRYYQRPQAPTAYSIYSCGSARSTTQIDWALALPVSMRIAPTAVDYSNVQGSLPGFAGYALSALVINHANTTYVGLLGTSSGLTQYRPYFLENNGTSGYIGLSAEL